MLFDQARLRLQDYRFHELLKVFDNLIKIVHTNTCIEFHAHIWSIGGYPIPES
jgi:hypothetical protein